MIDSTLKTLKDWYEQPGIDNDQSKLLSKLAVIELCGWLEEEFDRHIRTASNGRISDVNWLNENVIQKTHGFKYSHWRKMLCMIVGEMFASRVENEMKNSHSYEFDQLQNTLNKLWSDRCKFAHSDLSTNQADTQLTFAAPSKTEAEYILLKRNLHLYVDVLNKTLPPP